MLGTRARFAAAALAVVLVTASAGLEVLAVGSAPRAVPAAPSPSFPPIANWLTVFEDEFDGRFNGQPIVDTKDIDGVATPDGLDDRVWLPWGNFDPESISVTPNASLGDPGQPADGYLNLRTFHDGTRNRHPGWLTTGENEGERRALFESTYGYVEARVNMVQKKGVNSAFWMYSRDLHWWYSKPLRDPANAGMEIDIYEELDDHPEGVTHTLHWDGFADLHGVDGTGNEVVACPNSNCEGNFHTYGLLWDPSGYRFFIDGVETLATGRGLSHHPLFLVIGNVINRDPYAFGPRGDPRNALTIVDYVKVWQPAVSDIPNQTVPRNVPRAIPFTASSFTSHDPNLPGPRVATVTAEAASNCQSVVRTGDLVVTGSGADRTLALMTNPTGVAGSCVITVRARDAAGAVLGSDAFVVTTTDPAASLPSPASLPDLTLPATRPRAVSFRIPATIAGPRVTVESSNDYLVPGQNLGVTPATGTDRTLVFTPLPTRTGTTNITVTVTDASNVVHIREPFTVTVNRAFPGNGGFETGLGPWALIGGAGATSTVAARSGTQGFRMGVGAVGQLLAVEPNTTYVVAAWGRIAPSGGGAFDFGIADTHTYPDWDGDGTPDDFDGPQAASVRFTSTTWSRKEVMFTTGRHTHFVVLVANSYLVSNLAFDLDDVTLGDGPELTRIPDQSIGHGTCVQPKFWVGRVGTETQPWTVTAAVTGGDASLIAALSVQSPNPDNLYERGLRITPTSDETKSGKATVTVTVTDIQGRQRRDDVDVWVNAGSFRNGSFEHNPFGDTTYPGCDVIPRAWNHFYAPNASHEVIEPFDWKYGFDNWGLAVRQVVPASGSAFGGIVFQTVTGLQPDTEYVLSGHLDLRTWPERGVTLPDGVQLKVAGDNVTPLSPADGIQRRTTGGFTERVEVRFRTGAGSTAQVQLIAPNHALYYALFHDIALVKA